MTGGVRMAEGAARRKRGVRLEAAVLEAAWEELVEAGYSGLTMERVAARAGTSRSVLRRHWPLRADLVLAAMNHRAPFRPYEPPDTGELRADLLAVLRRVVARYEELRPVLPVLMTELTRSPELADRMRDRAIGGAPGMMRTIFDRAADRGEVRPERITPRVVALPIQLTFHDVVLTHGRTTGAALDGILDEIILPLVRGL